MSEDDETPSEKIKSGMSKSFLSLEEEEDMVTSFKKSKNISIQSAKMIEEVEDETKR